MKIKYDKKLLVAVGKSRMAKSWQNREILWSELLDKLSTTTRTRETVAEYAAMSKDDKNRCKDVGGFVAGYLKGGKRNNASVVNRCAVCLDADYADPGLLDDLDMTFIKGKVIRQERWAGTMQRSFYVGDALTEADIGAKLEHGVLSLNIPKKDEKKLPEKKVIMIEG